MKDTIAGMALIAVMMMTGASYAADKIVLTCSGTTWVKGQTVQVPLPSQSLVIDPNQGTVTGTFGVLSISKSTESKISLEGIAKNGNPVFGSIDRYSGFTVVSTWRNKEMVGTYNLTCKPATPLF
jgi:hypothetical protein